MTSSSESASSSNRSCPPIRSARVSSTSLARSTPASINRNPASVSTPHSFVFETDVVRKLVTLTPGGADEHFRDPQFSEPARTLTLPPPEGPPEVAALVADMKRYGVEVVGLPGPPRQSNGGDR
jgi:hypothetical protein